MILKGSENSGNMLLANTLLLKKAGEKIRFTIQIGNQEGFAATLFFINILANNTLTDTPWHPYHQNPCVRFFTMSTN